MRPHPHYRGHDDGAATLIVVVGAAIAALVLLIPLLMFIGNADLSTAAAACTPAGTTQPAPSAAADAIPASYLALFQQAGRQYGIPWTILAGIGKVESDDGTNDGPSNAGALGPMQFLPSTWQIYGDGGSIMNPAAAIPAAARLLLASGAPANIPAAIFAYNHSPDYVTDVLAWAHTYAADGYTVSASQQADCTLTAISQAPSNIAAEIINFAMKQIGKPYQWGATGPDAYRRYA
jgi:membrane-bound lytic murein transglycosylase B